VCCTHKRHFFSFGDYKRRTQYLLVSTTVWCVTEKSALFSQYTEWFQARRFVLGLWEGWTHAPDHPVQTNSRIHPTTCPKDKRTSFHAS